MSPDDVVEVVARVDSGRPQQVVGRFAQCLDWLHRAGPNGISSLHYIGFRLSHYVWILRHQHAVKIDTKSEPHTGNFPGSHARYTLGSAVEFSKVVRAGETNGKRRTRRKNGRAPDVVA